MTFWEFLKSKFGGDAIPISGAAICSVMDEYAAEVCFREMAFSAAVNLVANAISKCEIKIIENGEEVKGREWYLWNAEPNINQSSSTFIKQIISMLYRKNECLVVNVDDGLHIADSYIHEEKALVSDVFTQVTLRGGYILSGVYRQEDVLFFTLNSANMATVIDAVYASYSKLLVFAQNAYKKARGEKALVRTDALPVAGTDAAAAYDDLLQNKVRRFQEAANGALGVWKGWDYEDLGKGKTYSSETTRDIRAMINDIYDFTANTLSIPPALLRGDIQGTDEAVNQLLTFAVDPLADLLREEIIRKRIGQTKHLAGFDLVIDTRAIKHVDLLSTSNAIDKLIGSGVFSINDIRKLCGEQPIEEPWAWKHYITKNYTTFEAAMQEG